MKGVKVNLSNMKLMVGGERLKRLLKILKTVRKGHVQFVIQVWALSQYSALIINDGIIRTVAA